MTPFPDIEPEHLFTNEEVFQMIIDFALAYHKSENKDIAKDAAEFFTDKLKEKNANT